MPAALPCAGIQSSPGLGSCTPLPQTSLQSSNWQCSAWRALDPGMLRAYQVRDEAQPTHLFPPSEVLCMAVAATWALWRRASCGEVEGCSPKKQEKSVLDLLCCLGSNHISFPCECLQDSEVYFIKQASVLEMYLPDQAFVRMATSVPSRYALNLSASLVSLGNISLGLCSP